MTTLIPYNDHTLGRFYNGNTSNNTLALGHTLAQYFIREVLNEMLQYDETDLATCTGITVILKQDRIHAAYLSDNSRGKGVWGH